MFFGKTLASNAPRLDLLSFAHLHDHNTISIWVIMADWLAEVWVTRCDRAEHRFI